MLLKDIDYLIIEQLPPKDLTSLHQIKNKILQKLSEDVLKSEDYKKRWKDELIMENKLKQIIFNNSAYYTIQIPKTFIKNKTTGVINDDKAYKLILEKLNRANSNLTPDIQYLLQHGSYEPYDEENYHRNKQWYNCLYEYSYEETDVMIYYPTTDVRAELGSILHGEPMYSICVDFIEADQDYITLSSYKGNHTDLENYYQQGCLPYDGKRYHFKGLIYTRGV